MHTNSLLQTFFFFFKVHDFITHMTEVIEIWLMSTRLLIDMVIPEVLSILGDWYRKGKSRTNHQVYFWANLYLIRVVSSTRTVAYRKTYFYSYPIEMQVKIRLLNQGHSMSDIQKLQYQNQSRNMEHPLKKMHPEEPGKKRARTTTTMECLIEWLQGARNPFLSWSAAFGIIVD